MKNIGIVYLFTNELYETQNIYKFGRTSNPFERKRIQSNSTPPTYPFYDRIVLFSKDYKAIEKTLANRFRKEGILLTGDNGGTEWVKSSLKLLLSIYKDMLNVDHDAIMCYNGKGYKYDNGTVKVLGRIPDCSLDLLGINDKKIIKCKVDGQSYPVQNNKILVNGNEMTLSSYMKTYHPRAGKTNEYNGFQYFTYKGKNIYDMWQLLVKQK